MTADAERRLFPTGRFRLAPGLGLVRSYERGSLRADILAGPTPAAYLLPAGICDASLDRLPPEAGIYACLFSGLLGGINRFQTVAQAVPDFERQRPLAQCLCRLVFPRYCHFCQYLAPRKSTIVLTGKRSLKNLTATL